MSQFKDVDNKGKQTNKRTVSRRKFLAGAAAGAAAPLFVPASALGRAGTVAPSERIAVASIGLGIRGSSHVRGLLGYENVQFVALSDLFRDRREKYKKTVEDKYAQTRSTRGTYKGCDVYPDFREMLAREDVEAVIVATPEHWHALVGVAAAKAGKDIYGEKALTLTVREGQILRDTVRRYNRVFQTGTQQRSSRNFRFACELARNGYLGKLEKVEVGVPGGHALANSPTIPVPDGFDYETWLGASPVKPYNAIRCTSPEGWYHIYDYCAGWIQSWGVHHVDIALWGAPALTASTLEVEGTATFPIEGLGNTSLTWNVDFRTPDGLLFNFTDNSVNKQGCKFIGDKGWVHVNRGKITAGPESLLTVQLKPDDERLYESKSHYGNFLECVRNRRDPVAPVEGGHAATVASLVADIATRQKRKLTWDWKQEKFVGDAAANRMLSRPMRAPWRL